MPYVLGVDGGGTKTRAVVLDEQASIIGIGLSGPSNYDDVGYEQAKINLQKAILQACKELPGPSVLAAAYLGLAGIVSDRDIQIIMNMLEEIGISSHIPTTVSHDCRLALFGATGGEPGIVLISGTGSSCFGRNANGETFLSGGWGYLLADLGSSFYLGHQALMAIVNAYEGRGEATALTDPILKALKVNNITELMHRIYYPRLDRRGIASLAPIVVSLAERDGVAMSIIENGCKGLVSIVDSVVRKLHFQDAFPIVPVGGLVTSNSIYSVKLREMLAEAFPTAIISDPLASALSAAAILALKQIGIEMNLNMLDIEKRIDTILNLKLQNSEDKEEDI